MNPIASSAVAAMVLAVAAARDTTYWVTEYGADRDIEGYCEFGSANSYMVAYKVHADTCHRVTAPMIALDKMAQVQHTEDGAIVNSLDFCDRSCINCLIVNPDIKLNECYNSVDASQIIRKDFCIGSPNLEEASTVAFAFYPSEDCDHEAHMPDSGVVFVRNYNVRSSKGCELDYIKGNVHKYYRMNVTMVDGKVHFNGSFLCDDDECKSCDYVIETPMETEKCFKTQGGQSMKLVDNTKLSLCGGSNITDTENTPEVAALA